MRRPTERTKDEADVPDEEMPYAAHHTAEQMHDLVVRAEELLEEHHLVAWGRNMGVRERFTLDLVRHLHAMIDVQTVIISGAGVHDLGGFCTQLERGVCPAYKGCGGGGVGGAGSGSRTMRRSIDGPNGVCDLMRQRPSDLASHLKMRYYIWRDADVLLRQNARLFSRLVDAMAGVAAESEYASEDLLLIHRVIFVGSPALNDYFNDEKGQFRSWLLESPAGSKPLWSVVTGIEKPPVTTLELV